MEKEPKSLVYQIEVRGRIPGRWLDVFLDLQMVEEEDACGAVTKMTGSFSDPAGLQGLLNNLYNLGLVLISLECINECQPHGDKE